MMMSLSKRITAAAVVLILFLSSTTCFAAASHLDDSAGLLSPNEAASLEESLDALSIKHGIDIAVVTVYGIGNGMSPMEYADNYLETNFVDSNNDVNGVLLLVDMYERNWHISTCGSAIENITDYGLEYLEDVMIDDLSDGYYYDSFYSFAAGCDTLLDYASNNGYAYDYNYNSGSRGHAPKNPSDSIPMNLLISIVVGFIVSFISVSMMKSELKSVASQSGAANYVKGGSFNLTKTNDIYLYRNVSKTRRAETNSSSGHHGGSTTHHSSSGRSFGGRGGRF